MSLTIFESRQRAKDLIDQATKLWEESNYSDQLTGLGDDPVFKMLFTALSYQSSLLEAEIARIKSDVLSDLADYLVSHKGMGAVPATAVISTNLEGELPELAIDHNSRFSLGDRTIEFAPLLCTKVINVKGIEIVRLDGRRWRVALNFAEPVASLRGFSFAITDCNFKSVSASIAGRPLPLVAPWQFSEQPFTSYFSIDAMLYNRRFTFDPSAISIDLFASQNICNFVVKDFDLTVEKEFGLDKVEIVLEFGGINADFAFDKGRLRLNTIILANVSRQSRTLSQQNPIVKLADNAAEENEKSLPQFFMHLLPTATAQKWRDDDIIIRSYSTERFNSRALLDLINVTIAKIDTDRAAFRHYISQRSEEPLLALRSILADIKQLTEDSKSDARFAGIYAALRDPRQKGMDTQSIDLQYLTTMGAGINKRLSIQSPIDLPAGLSASHTRQIAEPGLGHDPQNGPEKLLNLSKYLFITADRLVTPADIKMFCLTVLQNQYGLDRNLIRSILVDHRPNSADRLMGYEIVVDISIANHQYVKKVLQPQTARIENILEKMILVRSANIYPVSVNILIAQN